MNTNTRTMSLGQSLMFAITIVLVALAAFMAGTSTAGAQSSDDDAITWLYVDDSTGDVALVTSMPFEDQVTQREAVSAIESVIDEELDDAEPMKLDRDLAKYCSAATGDMDGTTMTVIGCYHDETLVLIMATDPDVATEFAENMIDDGEPTTPAGYTDMSE